MAYLEATLIADDLPADAQVVGLSLRDAVSHLFSATVDFATEDPDLDLVALLGKPVAVRVYTNNLLQAVTAPLVVHGHVESAEYVDRRAHVHHYRLVLAPLVRALAHRVRSRIFQHKSAVTIAQMVLKDAGIPSEAVVWHVTPDEYPEREYCVQYQESELAFVMRLLEEEGIFFCFEHTETSHVMHIAASNDKLPSIPGDPMITASSNLHLDVESMADLVLARRVTADSFRARDWHFMSPDAPADAEAEVRESPTLEHYEYPGTFQKLEDGSGIAEIRAQELGLRAKVLHGASNSLRLLAGRKLTVAEAPVAQCDGDYILLSVRYQFRAPFSVDEGDEQTAYLRATFEAIPGDVPMRPERRTPRPRVYGIESAVVTGPPGEEIHVDEFGRVKVHFFWDREGKIDDKASCWIRVQQQNTSGSMLLPRVGWELSIVFLDGDPDRPIALQKLYNSETMPPYGMPDNKTQSALQSATSPGGGSTNEIRLQDGAGGMEFFVHSSKDLLVMAGNDATEEIKVDAHEEIGLELQTKVGVDETVKIGAEHSMSITKDLIDQTVAAKTVNVGAMDDWGITKNLGITAGGNRTETVGGMMNVLANQVGETFNANYTRTVGAILALNTASTLVEAVAGSKTETVGGAKVELIAKAKGENVGGNKIMNSGLVTEKTGKDMGITAKAALTINVAGPIAEKVGEAYTFTGKAVMVTSAGGAEMKAGGTKLNAKSGKLTVNASSLGAAGGPQLKLKGRINYKD